MIYLLFLLTSAVLFIALGVSLSDINPFQPDDLPMLEQIEAAMRSSGSSSTDRWDLLEIAA